jgi:hypothetical protein
MPGHTGSALRPRVLRCVVCRVLCGALSAFGTRLADDQEAGRRHRLRLSLDGFRHVAVLLRARGKQRGAEQQQARQTLASHFVRRGGGF